MTRHLQHCAATALLALGLLGGCSSLLPKPVPLPAQYTLDDTAPGAVSAAPLPAPGASAPTLVVNAPKAAPGFDTAHIVYVRRTHEIEYFAHNQWVDTPSRMLTPLIARAIERSGAFRAVLAAPTAATGRFRLDTELVRLQQDFSSTPSRVRFTLRAVLIDTASRSVVARREFDASVASTSEDPYGGVTAAQAVTQQVLAQLAAFCAEAAAR